MICGKYDEMKVKSQDNRHRVTTHIRYRFATTTTREMTPHEMLYQRHFINDQRFQTTSIILYISTQCYAVWSDTYQSVACYLNTRPMYELGRV